MHTIGLCIRSVSHQDHSPYRLAEHVELESDGTRLPSGDATESRPPPNSPDALTTRLSTCGERKKPASKLKTRPTRSFTKRRIVQIATTAGGFRSLPMQARCCWKSSHPALATTARTQEYSPRNGSAAFAQHDLQSTTLLVVRRLQELGRPGKPPCKCALSTSRKRMTPSTDNCFGWCSRALAYQRRC